MRAGECGGPQKGQVRKKGTEGERRGGREEEDGAEEEEEEVDGRCRGRRPTDRAKDREAINTSARSAN